MQCRNCAKVNDNGLYWVPTRYLKGGPIRQENVDALLPALRWTWRHLQQRITWCRTLEDWELGFMRDVHPTEQVVHWVRRTYAYLEFLHRNPTANKNGIFKALTAIDAGHDERIRPKSVATKLKKLLVNLPPIFSDMTNFTQDGHLKTKQKHLR
jgi:hypothetical protein